MNVASSDLLQAVRGPIMLITLGVLMSLDYFQGISFTHRTWPVLLIVFGVLKLAERSQRRIDYPPPYPPYPPYPGMQNMPPPPPPPPATATPGGSIL